MNWIDLHVRVGYALLVLVLFRLAWGFCGAQTARFRSFLAGPRAVAMHVAGLLKREPDLQTGHNPAGGWSVMLLLALLLGEVLTGLFALNDVADVGPLTELTPARVANAIDELHSILWSVLASAIALHLAAVAAYALAKGQNLVTPMFTGRKDLPAPAPALKFVSRVRAFAVLGGSALAAAALIHFL